MESILSINGKVFYAHVNGAIRQVMFDHAVISYNGICNGEFCRKVYFKVAGLDGLVTIAFGYNFNFEALYYSAEDAIECRNAVKQEWITEDAINSIADGFNMDKSGCAWGYVWNGSMPVQRRIEYASGTYGMDIIVSDGKARLDFGSDHPRWKYYKTKEECMAHNRAKVITF